MTLNLFPHFLCDNIIKNLNKYHNSFINQDFLYEILY